MKQARIDWTDTMWKYPATMDVNRIESAPHHYVRGDSGCTPLWERTGPSPSSAEADPLSPEAKAPTAKDFDAIAGTLPSNARSDGGDKLIVVRARCFARCGTITQPTKTPALN